MAVYDYTSSVTMVMVALEDGNIDGAVEVFKEDRTSFATFCIGVYPGFLFNENLCGGNRVPATAVAGR